jgi:hypothetical protein
MASFLINAILFLLLPVSVYLFEVDLAFKISVGIMMAFGICMAILNSSIVGLAGILPPKYMSAFMMGLSLNAFVPLVLRIITLASFGIMDHLLYLFGALIFFAINSIFMGLCAYGAIIVIKQNVIIYNLALTLDN